MFSRIIIENHTFCNRSCEFCTVPYLQDNNIKNKKIMTDDIFEKILYEISENIHLFKLPLRFSLFRHNEPLSDIPLLINRSKRLKEYFKSVETYVYIHTNGDYLTEDVLSKLSDIDEIHVNDYDNTGTIGVFEKIENLSKNIKIKSMIRSENNRDKIHASYLKKDIFFYIDSSNTLLKTTRGSFLSSNSKSNENWVNSIEARDYICDMKGQILVVDYDGSIMGCCEALSRIPYQNKDLCVGNISNGMQSFIENYDKINEFDLKSCKYCHSSQKVCGLR